MNTRVGVNPFKRLAYAFLALLAGDGMLLLYLLQNALRNRAQLLAAHTGEPGREIPFALDYFVLCAVFSFGGWLLLGVPTAALVPARFITRLPWLLTLIIGAVLGPLALFVVFPWPPEEYQGVRARLAQPHMPWELSVLVSTAAFVVYAALLRWESRRAQRSAVLNR